jgi:hypothetical protein
VSGYLFVLYIALLMSGYLFVLYIALLMSSYLFALYITLISLWSRGRGTLANIGREFDPPSPGLVSTGIVEPAHADNSIRQSPVLKGHLLLLVHYRKFHMSQTINMIHIINYVVY